MELSRNKEIYYTVILFFFIYGFPTLITPINSLRFSLILILFESIRKNALKIEKYNLILLLFITIISIYALIITGFLSGFRLTFPKMIFTIGIHGPIYASIFAYLLVKEKISLNKFIDLLINVFFAQAVIVILMFIFDPIREFFFWLSPRGLKVFKTTGFRQLGLSLYLLYDFGLFQSLGAVLISYKIFLENKVSNFLVFKYILICVTITMIARTGIIGMFVSLLFLIKSQVTSIKNFFYYFTRILFVLVIVNIAMVFLPRNVTYIINENLYPWFFEGWENYKATGSFSTGSSDYLIQHMYFEVSDFELMFGRGRYFGDLGFEGNTDAGYMRHILYFGLTGTVPLIIYYLTPMFILYRKMNLFKMIYPLIVLGLILVVHYKGDVLVGSSINYRYYHLIFFFWLYSHLEDNKLNINNVKTKIKNVFSN